MTDARVMQPVSAAMRSLSRCIVAVPRTVRHRIDAGAGILASGIPRSTITGV
jgi:hypothetical protein